MSGRWWQRILARTVTATAVLALMGGGIAQADVSLSEVGDTGEHWLREAPDHPGLGWGADCFYSPVNGRLRKVVAKWPVAYAYDYTAGNLNDEQWIGWRSRVQRWNGVSWITHWTSSVRKKVGDDVKRAPFKDSASSETITYDVPEPGLTLRVQVHIFWYQPGTMGTVSGSTNHVVETYSYRTEGGGGLFLVNEAPCPPLMED